MCALYVAEIVAQLLQRRESSVHVYGLEILNKRTNLVSMFSRAGGGNKTCGTFGRSTNEPRLVEIFFTLRNVHRPSRTLFPPHEVSTAKGSASKRRADDERWMKKAHVPLSQYHQDARLVLALTCVWQGGYLSELAPGVADILNIVQTTVSPEGSFICVVSTPADKSRRTGVETLRRTTL